MRFRDLQVLARGRSPAGWPAVQVLFVWLPQLPLRVEVLRRPSLDAHPLVLGGGPGQRKVVQQCSPQARRAGIRPGLPLREVLPLCPEAVILQPDPVRAGRILEEVLASLQRVTPAVEADAEGFFLDVRGLNVLYAGDFEALVQDVSAAVPPPLLPRVGAAAGKFAAAVAARLAHPPAACVVRANETEAFLAPLPLSHLPFEPEALERLELMGLTTIGELAALPVGAVQAQFGSVGARAWHLAKGQDERPVVPKGSRPSVHASLRFDDPLASTDALLFALDHLLSNVSGNPVLQGRSARQVRLRALLSDGTSWERLYTFKEALRSRDAAFSALKARLALPHGLPPAPVEELFLELLGLGGEAARQGSLFVARARQEAQIAEATRQLCARYGRVPLYHAVEVEPWSRIPERRWALVTCDF